MDYSESFQTFCDLVTFFSMVLHKLFILYSTKLRSIFSTKSNNDIEMDVDVENDVDNCLFCRISRHEAVAKIVYEDNDFVAFHDIKPSAKNHILLVPRQHIESVKSFLPSDRKMVERMMEIGQFILESYGVEMKNRKLGFHIPP